MQEKKKKLNEIINKININLVITLLFSAVFFISIIIKNHGIMYIMNDDIAIRSIASGIYLGGEPSAHMVFVAFPFNIIVSLLYKLTINIDWYGIILIGGMIFYITYTIYHIIKDKKSITEKIVYAASCFFIIAMLFNTFLVDITFTVVAALIAICCLVLYMLPSSKFKNIVMSVGIILAYGIRPKSCLMVLALFLPVFLYKNLGNKETLKKDFILGSKIAIILIICMIVQKIMVSDASWKEYLIYNKNRSEFYDYYYNTVLNIPEEKRKQIFEKAGFNKDEMDLICSYGAIGFLEEVPQKMAKLIEECKIYDNKEISSDFVTKFLYMMRNTKIAKYYIITIFLLGYYVIKSRKRKIKIPIFLFLMMIQLSMLSYLVYKGRMPDRVLVSLFASYIICNIGLLLSEIETKEIIHKIINYDKVFFIIITMIAFLFGIKSVKVESITREQTKIANEMVEYFEQHPDNFYIYDKNSFDIFKIKTIYKANNYLNMSGWTVFSPLYQEKINKQGVKTLKELAFQENVFLVIPYSLEDEKEKITFLFKKDAKIELKEVFNGNYIYKIKPIN